MDIDLDHIANPFSLDPVKSHDLFVGRPNETRETLSLLHNGQSVAIAGGGKIGKTSFLNHISDPDTRAEIGLAKDRQFIYLDCRQLRYSDLGQCYFVLRRETVAQLSQHPDVDNDFVSHLDDSIQQDVDTAHFGVQRLFRKLDRANLKLVLVLDDFEVLANNTRLPISFFAGLRSLTTYNIAYLVTSMFALDVLEKIREGSPFFNVFYQISLKAFMWEESRALIKKHLKENWFNFPNCIIDKVLELGNNRPHLLQLAGSIAFNVWQEQKGHLDDNHCEVIALRFQIAKQNRP